MGSCYFDTLDNDSLTQALTLTAFHGVDEYTFRKAIRVLEEDGRARTFERKGKTGITFFALR